MFDEEPDKKLANEVKRGMDLRSRYDRETRAGLKAASVCFASRVALVCSILRTKTAIGPAYFGPFRARLAFNEPIFM